MRGVSGETARKEGGALVSLSFLVPFRSARVAQQKRTTASGLHQDKLNLHIWIDRVRF